MGMPEPQAKRYVTVQDAVGLLNVAERTVRRMMDEKRLHFVKDRAGHCRIDLDDIEKELQSRPRTISPQQQLLQEVQMQVKDLQKTIREQEHRIETVEYLLEKVQQQSGQEPLLIHLSSQEQMQEGAATFSVGEISQLVTKQVLANLHLSSHIPQGIVGMIAKRNLPVGTMRLVDFAHQHEISVHAIKKGYYEHAFALTVHQRAGTVKRNHQEWWISQEQHQPVIAYCQQHAIPYVPCPHCQDTMEKQQVG
jgi:excisionase family DNA binding protein